MKHSTKRPRVAPPCHREMAFAPSVRALAEAMEPLTNIRVRELEKHSSGIQPDFIIKDQSKDKISKESSTLFVVWGSGADLWQPRVVLERVQNLRKHNPEVIFYVFLTRTKGTVAQVSERQKVHASTIH